MTADFDDWVAFGEADTFRPEGIESAKKEEMSRRRPKKREKKRRSDRESSASTMSWMEKPIADDSSWLPIEPPRYECIEGRDEEGSRRSNHAPVPSTPTLSRPPRVSRHTSSSAASEGDPSRVSASSESQNQSWNNISYQERGRDRRPSSRGRSGSESRDQPPLSSSSRTRRGRSSSRTRTDPSPVRARSSSKTRVEQAPKRSGRHRSTSRTRVESPSPGNRYPSRTRAPSPSPRRIPAIPPMPNVEPKSRGRSASLTPSASRAHSRSQSLTRFRQSLSPRGLGSNRSVSSFGNGVPPRHSTSFADGSSRSGQFGVASQIDGQDQSRTKSLRKQGGILERFFGDQVSKDAKNGFNSTAHSNTSIGSLGASQQAESIHPRVLLSATVYKNAATNLWIATINTNQKGVATDPKLASKYLKAFSFGSEQEAREAAIANAPPKMMLFEESPNCFVCKGKFAVFRRARHCRNCGACVCGSCTTSWSSRMLPETYNLKNESVVKVCRSCSFLTDSFRKALLKGDLDEAIELYHTGNINLRCPLPAPVCNKKAEIMYPVHCAVQGGNLNIVRWLLDEHFCPIKLVKKSSKSSGDIAIVTSKGRSVLNIAMSSLKVDIIRYLVVEKGVPVYETKDLQLSLRALEAVLLAFPAKHNTTEFDTHDVVLPRWDETNFSDDEESYICSSLGEDQSNPGELSFTENQPIENVDLVSQSFQYLQMCIVCYFHTSSCSIVFFLLYSFSASFAMTMLSTALSLLVVTKSAAFNAAAISRHVQFVMSNVILFKSLNRRKLKIVMG